MSLNVYGEGTYDDIASKYGAGSQMGMWSIWRQLGLSLSAKVMSVKYFDELTEM